MEQQRIKPPKLSQLIEAQLEQLIQEGSYAPGERLPAERELAQRFDVSRPSIREAIQALEVKGLLERKQGGGCYVTEPVKAVLQAPLQRLLVGQAEAQFDLLEFRLALEAISAYLAALRGTEADFDAIRAAAAKLTVAEQGSLEQEAQAAMRLIEITAEASHNLVLLHIFLGLKQLLLGNIQQNLALLKGRPLALTTVREHRQHVIEAITSRQPESAREATQRHLVFIEETLLALDQENSRQARTTRRLSERGGQSD